MNEALTRILSMFAIIIIGNLLRMTGLVKRDDFRTVTNIQIYVALPAAILLNFDGFQIDASFAVLPVLAIVFFFLTCLFITCTQRNKSRQDCAFLILNSSAYNTGGFSLVFAQNLLPSAGVVAVSLFDIGNCVTTSVFCYIVASAVLSERGKITPRYVVSQLLHSFPFLIYFTATALCLLRIRLPEFIMAPARLIAPANTVLAMLSVGIGMNLRISRSELKLLMKAVGYRYIMAVPLALICWFLLPFDKTMRMALLFVSFSSSTLFGAVYTAKIDGNYALANTVISVTSIISTLIVTCLMMYLY
ncbi:MAG: AEC family transporter [Candidatus Heteroscillospira sp.]